MTVQEHVQWARRRAHDYVDRGNLTQAVASMTSDLGKHEDTAMGMQGCLLAYMLLQNPDDPEQIREWIDGCVPAVEVERL